MYSAHICSAALALAENMRNAHIPVLEEREGVVFLNPGSTTIPKGGSMPSYAVWDSGKISIISPSRNPVISVISRTFRLRSGNLPRCTITSIPDAICCRIACNGKSIPISTIISKRLKMSRLELPCAVESPPSCPVFAS